MARPLRVDYPGALHHVMNRATRREPVFADPDSAQLLLEIVGELPGRFGVRVHGWALMPNHFHLLIEAPRGNLSRAMRYLGARFTQRLNARKGWDGPVFRGRFKNRVVEDEAYWRHLLVYLHLNPVTAGLVPYPDATIWSSHAVYAGLSDAQDWLTTEDSLALYGGQEGYRAYLLDIMSNRGSPPPSFDPDRLWSRARSAEIPPPAAPPRKVGMTADEAITTFERITGATLEQARTPKFGPGGNPMRRLAAWWLVRSAHLPQRDVASLLAASPALVSRWLGDPRGTDVSKLEPWMRALEAELTR